MMRPREHGQFTHLEPLHLLDVILAILGCRRVGEIDRHSLEELSLLGSDIGKGNCTMSTAM